MRIWSLHPKYLDAKGLVALWRETLLAKHVLEGKTIGYKNHPQLDRFKKCKSPTGAINFYLLDVYNEAVERGYNFDRAKINLKGKRTKMKVNDKQMDYEVEHLMRKLKKREPTKYKEVKTVKFFEAHPLFKIVKGNIENWEILGN